MGCYSSKMMPKEGAKKERPRIEASSRDRQWWFWLGKLCWLRWLKIQGNREIWWIREEIRENPGSGLFIFVPLQIVGPRSKNSFPTFSSNGRHLAWISTDKPQDYMDKSCIYIADWNFEEATKPASIKGVLWNDIRRKAILAILSY